MSKSIDESLEWMWGLWRELETYKLIYGELKDPYGKVDVMTAYQSYRDKEPFLENFGRYLELLDKKLSAPPKVSNVGGE